MWLGHALDATISRTWTFCDHEPEAAQAIAELIQNDAKNLFAWRSWSRRDLTETADERRSRSQAVLLEAAQLYQGADPPNAYSYVSLLAAVPAQWLLDRVLTGARPDFWAPLAFMRFRHEVEADIPPPDHIERVDAFAEARLASPHLSQVSAWYFETGLSLDDEGVVMQREMAREAIEGRSAEAQAKAEIAVEQAKHLARLVDDPNDSWWKFVRAIRLRPGVAGVEEHHRTPIEETDWWRCATELNRGELLTTARRYLSVGDPYVEEWYGRGRYDYRAAAGYAALELLQSQRPETLNGLSREAWARWVPVMLPSISLAERWELVRRSLLSRAFAVVPDRVREWIERAAIHEAATSRYAFVLQHVDDLIDDRLARALLAHLDDDLAPSGLASLLAAIAERLPDETATHAKRWLNSVVPTARAHELAVVGARHLLRQGAEEAWSCVWDVFERRTELGRDAIAGSDFFIDRLRSTLGHISAGALAQAWRWLAKEWPYSEERTRSRHVIVGEEFRDHVLDELKTRASGGALDAFSALYEIQRAAYAPSWLRVRLFSCSPATHGIA